MEQLLCIQTPEDLKQLTELAGLSPIESALFQQHQPDAHWVLLHDDRIVSHCSLWWRTTGDAVWPSESIQTDFAKASDATRLGYIGHYNAQDAIAAQRLLEVASQELSNQGCTMAIAPIDGNTWRRYRCLSQRCFDEKTEPLFFLEPDNPDEWREHFLQAGFGAIAQYSSALTTDLSYHYPRVAKAKQRLIENGIVVRSLNLENFEQELHQIHQLSLISFRNNFLYTPIEAAEFIAQYRPIKSYIQPELVLLAKQGENLIGFLFAIPDLLQAKRGETINTIIIKTVAVLPGRAYAGLGNWLVAECQAIAYQQGYTRAIHALMHDDNNSRNLSARYAHPIRRYTLFGKLLL